MKTLKIFFATAALFATFTSQAQVSVSVNVGLPAWGPPAFPAAEFYYLPEIETYYDVHQANFIYFGAGRWIRSRHLPAHCADYDLYRGRTVVLDDYHGHAPYRYYREHRVRYAPRRTYAYRPAQVVYVKEKHHGHGNGHYKGKGRGHGHHH